MYYISSIEVLAMYHCIGWKSILFGDVRNKNIALAPSFD